MIKKIFLFSLFLAISFSLDISPQMVESAKQQYGVSDAQLQEMAKQYVEPNYAQVAPTEKQKINNNKSEETKMDSDIAEEETEETTQEEPLISAKFPKNLKLFGYNIFNQVAMTFTPLRNIPVGGDYVLGTGDELKIYLWGNIQQNFSVVVDAQGNIDLPRVGRLTISNLPLERASKLIETEMGKHFANFTMEVTMGQLKTIPVFVLGAVKTPGKYNVDSLSTLLHALYSSGGPSTRGTLRNIQLIRDNKVFRLVDLYDLFLYGKNSSDILLRANDIIFVPAIGSVVAVDGAVKNPAIFEINDNTSLYDLFSMAGEFTRNSYVKNINIIRKNNDSDNFELKTVSFASWNDFLVLSKRITLREGDLVNVISLSDDLKGWIEISGDVLRSGIYSTDKVSNMKDLIELAGGLSFTAFLDRAHIHRTTSANNTEIIAVSLSANNLEEITLKEFDRVTIYSNRDRLLKRQVSIVGEVNKASTHDFFQGMTIKDLLFLANDYTFFADRTYLQIFRTLTKDVEKIIEINKFDESFLNTKLHPLDKVFIRRDPHFRDYGTVVLEGEVLYPGSYPLYKDETLAELIERAGGFQEDAFISALELYRDVNSNKSFFSLQKTESNERNLKIISSLADFNRIRINYYGLFVQHNLEYDIVLRDGDRIVIPKVSAEINVVGGVYNAGAFIYSQNSTLGDYLNKAGNFRKDADEQEIFVVHASGTVTKTNKRNHPIQRGDSIIVPTKEIQEVDIVKAILDFTQILFNVATTWAVIFK
jgi:protein involved in polysaccharide export with SLBB domain